MDGWWIGARIKNGEKHYLRVFGHCLRRVGGDGGSGLRKREKIPERAVGRSGGKRRSNKKEINDRSDDKWKVFRVARQRTVFGEYLKKLKKLVFFFFFVGLNRTWGRCSLPSILLGSFGSVHSTPRVPASSKKYNNNNNKTNEEEGISSVKDRSKALKGYTPHSRLPILLIACQFGSGISRMRRGIKNNIIKPEHFTAAAAAAAATDALRVRRNRPLGLELWERK